MWKIEKTVKKGDYLYAVVPTHPRASKHGYVLYHRVIIENHLKRILNTNEVVHHIDGNKDNNDISNLKVMEYKEHVRLHQHKKSRKYVLLKCPWCDKLFEIPKNRSFLDKGNKATFCSRKCNGSFLREVQLNGLTHKLETAVSENLVKIFDKCADDNSEETKD